ncbi:phage tail length tape measure family protein [Brucella anthropi]|uniref:phage tail length tape measure family protein n=1 Tax=Brucella anthropi TaxID=529 RepID=UPI00384CC521
MTQSKFELLFTAETKQAKAATSDLRNDVAALGNQASSSSADLDKQTAALNREAEAARKATENANRLAEAEKRAAAARASTTFSYETREQTEARLGLKSRPQSNAPASPVSAPQLPPAPNVPNKWADDLRARYVPLYEAQRDYTNELARVSQAQRENILTAEEATAAEVRLKAAYDKKVEGIKRSDPALRSLNDNYKLTAHEARNLSYQMNDVFQSFMLGMPVQQIVLQQGPQIAQIYGGVGNTLKAVAAQATLGRVALGGVAAAALTGASAWNAYLKSVKEVSTAANGLGRSTAGSMQEMEAAAQAGAAAAGISVASARSMEAQFLRTGKIGSEHFEKLIGLSKDFSVTFGMETEAAGKALSDMFADPEKAAQALFRQYGLIDAATARQATNLARSNRIAEAQGVLLAALPERLANATEATTAFARAWEHVRNAASGAFDWVGRTIDKTVTGPTLDQQIDAVRARFEQLQRSNAGRSSEAQRWAYQNGASDVETEKSVKEQLDALLEKKRVRDEAAARLKQQAEDIRTTAAALNIAENSPATASLRQQQELRSQIAAMEAARGKFGDDLVGRDMNEAAIEAKTRALDALTNRQQRSIELDRLDIQIANERNPLIRAELEARRTRLQLSEQEVSSDTLAAEAARARSRVIEETLAPYAAQSRDMQEEVQIRQRLSALVASGAISSEDANRMLQEELTLRPLIAAAAMAEGVEKQRLNKVISDQKNVYAALAEEQKRAGALDFIQSQQERIAGLRLELAVVGESEATRQRSIAQLAAEQETRRRGLDTASREAVAIRSLAVEQDQLARQLEQQSAARDYIRSQQERIASLRVELAVVGETESVRARVMAQLEAEQEIRRRGLDTASSEAAAVRSQAVEQDKLVRQLEKQSDAWRTVRQAGENAIDSIVDKITSGDLSGALENVAKNITRTLLTLGTTNNLKNGFLGTEHGTIADAGGPGGLVSKLFGGDGKVDADGIIRSALGSKPVGAMSVNAATVMINGAGGVGANVSRLLSGSNDNAGNGAASLPGGGNPLSFIGNYKSGVDPRLTDILNTAAQNFPGFRVDAISGFRPGDPRFHGKGLATDVRLTDLLNGKMLGNYQDASPFRTYEQFAQVARQVQMQKYPELADQFRWGGYFSGGKGKYGALDTMHFDLAGGKTGMGGGSWANGLTPQQMALWPGVTSKGMDTATAALERLAATTTSTTQNLGQFGGGLENIAQGLLGSSTGGAGTGGGLGGLFSGLLGLLGFSDGGFTGAGAVNKVAGIVHAGEVVWSQRDVQRAGGVHVVEAMRLGRRGYDSGGIVHEVGPSPLAAYYRNAVSQSAGVDNRPVIQVINNSSAPVTGEVEETTDARGKRQHRLVLSDAVADGMAAPGGRGRRTMQQVYGIRPTAKRRA